MYTKCGVNSSSHFPFRAWPHTDTQRDPQTGHTHSLIPMFTLTMQAWVITTFGLCLLQLLLKV